MRGHQHIVIKYLDAPMRFLSFSFQDLFGYSLPFFIGALVDDMLTVPLCGLIITYMVKRGLAKLPKFYCLRFLYWNLPTRRFNRLFKVNLPKSEKRIWVK
jgi:type IV conjugative transfer system protein TraL